MEKITWDYFAKADLRIGKIVSAETFPKANQAAYILQVDFGDLGILKSSAQITHYYNADSLVGKLVVGIVNIEPKQIGPIMSECLITGFFDRKGETILCTADAEFTENLALGAKLF